MRHGFGNDANMKLGSETGRKGLPEEEVIWAVSDEKKYHLQILLYNNSHRFIHIIRSNTYKHIVIAKRNKYIYIEGEREK